MKTRLNLVALTVLALAACAPSPASAQSLPAPGPVALAGVYDAQTHSTSAVVTYNVKSYGTAGKLSIDLLGFGGSTVGPKAAITGGGALVASYPLSFNALRFRVGFGPAIILTANDKPHIGFFGGLSGSF